MAYTALYRAYRPQDFKSVAGQRHIVTTLQNAIKLNHVAHAYLFTGPRGTGKTTMAKIMAKALNCKEGPTIEPCNECEICKGITKGTISDVVEIDAASNNGVDEIRDLRDRVKYLPSECRFKVYIIDEVHMLSQGAFNALLKTLEEPPLHVIFILATTEPHKIPATILSRCQRFDFQSLSKEDIIGRLKKVIEAEKLNVTGDALELVADFCDGGMRDALSLLDQSISYSTDDVVDEADILAVSGNVSTSDILLLVRDLSESNGANALSKLQSIISNGKEIPRIINDLVVFLRDILLFKIGKNESMKSIYQTNEYQSFAAKVPNQLVYHWLDILNETLNNIKFTNQKRAYLELAILKMSDTVLNDYEMLIKKVENLEARLAFGAVKAPEEPKNGSIKLNFETNPENIQFEAEATIEPISKDDDEYIKVIDIENILNSADKNLKNTLVSNLLAISNPNDFVANMLEGAKIGACNQDKAVIVLSDSKKCNRLMKGSFYSQAIKLLNNDTTNINEIYFVPEESWSLIIKDFMEQYKSGILLPKLHEINLMVKRHVDEENSTNDFSDLESLFGSNVLKITEE